MSRRLAVFRPIALLPLLCGFGCAAVDRGTLRDGPTDAAVADARELGEHAVLLQLIDRQHYEPWLVQRMASEEAPVREALAVALGRIGDPRGRETLERLVVDSDPSVRRAAVFALGLLEDFAAAPMLLWVAADADSQTGALAVEALARIGVPLDRVEGALQALADPAERRRRLLPALFRFPQEGRVAAARAALDARALALHRSVAYALAREPFPTALPELRELLTDADSLIRAWAGRALGRVGEGEDLARLRPLLRDAQPGPVIEALRAGAALIERGAAAPPADWRDDLLRLFDDPRAGVRGTAIEVSAAWLLDDALGAALAERVERGPAGERGQALLALARGGDRRAGVLAGRLASADDGDLRVAAASAAAVLEDRAALLRLHADPTIGVRLAVISGALETAGRAPLAGGEGSAGRSRSGSEPASGDGDRTVGDLSAAAWIERGLADPSWIVRAATLEWLAEHPVVATDELLGATGEASPADLWLEVVPALEARATAVGEERIAAADALQALARRSEFRVRRAAAEALEALGFAAPEVGVVETGKDLSAYREIVRQTRERPTVEIATTRGAILLRLACPEAPLTCLNFLQLVRQGYFDGVRFHRVVPHFVAQGGDRTGTGWGGPGYALRDELNRRPYELGSVGMALSGPDTGSSQFFVTLSRQPHLDGRYTNFADVVEGMDVVDALVQGDRILAVRVLAPVAAPPATFANTQRSIR